MPGEAATLSWKLRRQNPPANLIWFQDKQYTNWSAASADPVNTRVWSPADCSNLVIGMSLAVDHCVCHIGQNFSRARSHAITLLGMTRICSTQSHCLSVCFSVEPWPGTSTSTRDRWRALYILHGSVMAVDEARDRRFNCTLSRWQVPVVVWVRL